MSDTKTQAQDKKYLLGNTKTTSFKVTKNRAGYALSPNTSYYLSVTAVKGDKESTSSTVGSYKTAFSSWILEDENVELSYGNTTIHLGQAWSNDIKSKLGVNSSASYTYDRCDVKIAGSYHSVTAYVFDASDYSDYLLVEVCEGQIMDWYTNASTQAIVNGKAVKRGENKTFDTQYSLVRYTNVVAPLLVPFNESSYASNGVVISGAMAKDYRGDEILADDRGYESPSINRWDEKQVGLHIINAYRVLSNRRGHKLNPLQYNKYLDGTNPDGTYIRYTGNIKTLLADGKSYGYFHVNNQAFGAQGYVDTLTWGGPADLSKSMHSMFWRTAGPCAGGLYDLSEYYDGQQAWDGILQSLSYIASYKADLDSTRYLSGAGQNAASGGVGESALVPYTVSSGHLTWYTADNDKLQYIGIGIKNGYNQVFGGEKSNNPAATQILEW